MYTTSGRLARSSPASRHGRGAGAAGAQYRRQYRRGETGVQNLLNRRLRQLAGASADHVCTPVDLRDGLVPRSGLLEVVVHPSALGYADFGDAYLHSGESLLDLLEDRLPGVKRVGYGVLARGTARAPRLNTTRSV